MKTSPISGRVFTLFLWPLLLVIYLVLGFTYSVIQPLGRTPDETAHVQYVQFLANNGCFPIFNPQGGGEAGYEAQHPPLFYAVEAVVYQVTSDLPENWRWNVMRWSMLLIGVALFCVCRRFFSEMWPRRPWLAWGATATVLWMPLTLLYTCYVNPDGLVVLWTTLVLVGSVRATRSPVTPRHSVWLGVWCALGLLTKLSSAPALVIAVLAQMRARDERRGQRLALTLGTVLLLAGPWYLRNALLYGSPFIHTQGKLGTGIQYGFQAGFGAPFVLSWRETFLSTWVQRGWFPAGTIEWTLYGVIVLGIALATIGLVQQKTIITSGFVADGDLQSLRFALNVSGLLIVLVFLGQQWAFWTQDVEFNAGGRYMLATMVGIGLLLFAGWERLGANFRKVWIPLWLLSLLVMNAASIDNIVGVLNPTYAKGWQMFQFPP